MAMKPPVHDPHPGQPKACNLKRGDPFYCSARWRRLRRLVLNRQPVCLDPFNRHVGPEPATEVDHIVPRLEAPELAYTLSNLRGRCRRCHSTVSAKARWAR